MHRGQVGCRGGPCDREVTRALVGALLGAGTPEAADGVGRPLEEAQFAELAMVVAAGAEGGGMDGDQRGGMLGAGLLAVGKSHSDTDMFGSSTLGGLPSAQSLGGGLPLGVGGGVGETSKVFNVEQGCLGAIIGKGGQVLNSMREETGCQISVSSNNARSTLPPGTVILTGSERQVADAMDSIQQKVEAAGYRVQF